MRGHKLDLNNLTGSALDATHIERGLTPTGKKMDNRKSDAISRDAVLTEFYEWNATGESSTPDAIKLFRNRINRLQPVESGEICSICSECKQTYPDCASGADDMILAKRNDTIIYCNKFTSAKTTDLKAFAARFNNREYLEEMTEKDRQYAVNHGIVVVFGASDDLIEFDGAIYDEQGCFNGGMIYLDKDGVSQGGEKLNNSIRAVWCGKDEYGKPLPGDFKDENGNIITWCYVTDIPHETFMIYDEGEPYCRGIVFLKEDLK